MVSVKQTSAGPSRRRVPIPIRRFGSATAARLSDNNFLRGILNLFAKDVSNAICGCHKPQPWLLPQALLQEANAFDDRVNIVAVVITGAFSVLVFSFLFAIFQKNHPDPI